MWPPSKSMTDQRKHLLKAALFHPAHQEAISSNGICHSSSYSCAFRKGKPNCTTQQSHQEKIPKQWKTNSILKTFARIWENSQGNYTSLLWLKHLQSSIAQSKYYWTKSYGQNVCWRVHLFTDALTKWFDQKWFEVTKEMMARESKSSTVAETVQCGGGGRAHRPQSQTAWVGITAQDTHIPVWPCPHHPHSVPFTLALYHFFICKMGIMILYYREILFGLP